MFEKLVAIEPVSLIPSAEKELFQYAKEVVLYDDIPADDEEIIRRIGDADAVLLSYTSRIERPVLERCPNIRYIGMCCSHDRGTALIIATFEFRTEDLLSIDTHQYRIVLGRNSQSEPEEEKHPKQSNHKHHPFFLYGCKYKQNARKAAISLQAFTIILLLSYSGRL